MIDVEKEMAAIKARHEALRHAMEQPKCSEFVIPEGVRPEQIGLRPVMCDSNGRLWDVSSNPIQRVFPPPTKDDK
jgi:hypothetical protein